MFRLKSTLPTRRNGLRIATPGLSLSRSCPHFQKDQESAGQEAQEAEFQNSAIELAPFIIAVASVAHARIPRRIAAAEINLERRLSCVLAGHEISFRVSSASAGS